MKYVLLLKINGVVKEEENTTLKKYFNHLEKTLLEAFSDQFKDFSTEKFFRHRGTAYQITFNLKGLWSEYAFCSSINEQINPHLWHLDIYLNKHMCELLPVDHLIIDQTDCTKCLFNENNKCARIIRNSDQLIEGKGECTYFKLDHEKSIIKNKITNQENYDSTINNIVNSLDNLIGEFKFSENFDHKRWL